MSDKKTSPKINKIPNPNVVINLDEKIYLAAAPDNDAKDTTIHTLSCSRQNGNYYDLFATHEVNLFENPKIAKLFYDAIIKIIERNKANQKYRCFFEWNDEIIKELKQNVK